MSPQDPFTHIYMYDLGFPPPLQQKIAEYFNASTHAQYLVSYRPPRRVMHEYGYDVEPIGKLSTSMTGELHFEGFYTFLFCLICEMRGMHGESMCRVW
jgi:hypothetical protein